MNIKVIKHYKRMKKKRFEDVLVHFIGMHLGTLGVFQLKRNESAEEALLREGVLITIQ